MTDSPRFIPEADDADRYSTFSAIYLLSDHKPADTAAYAAWLKAQTPAPAFPTSWKVRTGDCTPTSMRYGTATSRCWTGAGRR